MKKAEFLELVKIELDTIKEKATAEEISKLNPLTFNSMSTAYCIYGQMTGNCMSKRAMQLYPKSFEFILGRSFRTQNKRPGRYFTALEKYLIMVSKSSPNKYKQIIQYLKGERDTIKL